MHPILDQQFGHKLGPQLEETAYLNSFQSVQGTAPGLPGFHMWLPLVRPRWGWASPQRCLAYHWLWTAPTVLSLWIVSEGWDRRCCFCSCSPTTGSVLVIEGGNWVLGLHAPPFWFSIYMKPWGDHPSTQIRHLQPNVVKRALYNVPAMTLPGLGDFTHSHSSLGHLSPGLLQCLLHALATTWKPQEVQNVIAEIVMNTPLIPM